MRGRHLSVNHHPRGRRTTQYLGGHRPVTGSKNPGGRLEGRGVHSRLRVFPRDLDSPHVQQQARRRRIQPGKGEVVPEQEPVEWRPEGKHHCRAHEGGGQHAHRQLTKGIFPSIRPEQRCGDREVSGHCDARNPRHALSAAKTTTTT